MGRSGVKSRASRTGTARAAAAALSRLERIRQMRGEGVADQKLSLLTPLADRAMANPQQVRRLHETLCFLRAYPDDGRVLRRAEAMLVGFGERPDLITHREALRNSGIAGTPIHSSFYYSTVVWLSERWPSFLHVDWENYEDPDRLLALLPLLMPAQDGLVLEESELGLKDLVQMLKGPDESDATFLARRFQSLKAAEPVRQMLFDELDIPMRLEPGPSTPSRSASRLHGAKVFYVHEGPGIDHDWRSMRPPVITDLSPARGERLVDLGRTQMITRNRDLYAFMNADPRDIRLMDMGDGLQFASLGLVPESRFLIETMYVYVALQSGVPVGYMQASALLRSAEINFNVFDSFRGAQARHVLRAFLAMVHHTLGCDTFIINSQQLGQGNSEALKTGAFWFYHKFGFRPRNQDVERVMNAELKRKARDPAHRSSIATLRQLSVDYLFLFTGRPRTRTVSTIHVGRVGAQISHYLAARFGARREEGIETCAQEAARMLGLRRPPSGSPAQREAWRNWAPLILLLPGCAHWPRAQKQALVEIVRAKGGRRESEYLLRFDAHRRLVKALLRMMERDAPEVAP